MNGKAIKCQRCRGIGVVDAWVNIPDECGDCGGSGQVWRYKGGAIARYYSGPLLCGPDKKSATLRAHSQENG